MATLGDLASKMQALREQLPTYANEKKKEAVTVVHNELLLRTPVDTGQAVSNWIVSVNAPVADDYFAYAPSPRGAMLNGVWTHTVDPSVTREANAPFAQEQRDLTLATTEPEEIVYITNSLPYIQRLENGSSSQAPVGFVDASILVGTTTFESASAIKLVY